MSYREIVRSDFEEFIRLDPMVPEDLKTSLRLTERVPQFIDNLAAALIEVDRRGKVKLSRMKIKNIVFEQTAFFVHLLKTKADEMAMSDAAKSLQKSKIEGDPILQKFDAHGNADLTEELGIVIKDGGNGSGSAY